MTEPLTAANKCDDKCQETPKNEADRSAGNPLLPGTRFKALKYSDPAHGATNEPQNTETNQSKVALLQTFKKMRWTY